MKNLYTLNIVLTKHEAQSFPNIFCARWDISKKKIPPSILIGKIGQVGNLKVIVTSTNITQLKEKIRRRRRKR